MKTVKKSPNSKGTKNARQKRQAPLQKKKKSQRKTQDKEYLTEDVFYTTGENICQYLPDESLKEDQ